MLQEASVSARRPLVVSQHPHGYLSTTLTSASLVKDVGNCVAWGQGGLQGTTGRDMQFRGRSHGATPTLLPLKNDGKQLKGISGLRTNEGAGAKDNS